MAATSDASASVACRMAISFTRQWFHSLPVSSTMAKPEKGNGPLSDPLSFACRPELRRELLQAVHQVVGVALVELLEAGQDALDHPRGEALAVAVAAVVVHLACHVEGSAEGREQILGQVRVLV